MFLEYRFTSVLLACDCSTCVRVFDDSGFTNIKFFSLSFIAVAINNRDRCKIIELCKIYAL